MPHVPVGVMVPPIVKQASLYGYNNHDFDFFITLAKHPRLTLRNSLLLVDLLGKICLNDPLFGRVATVPFLCKDPVERCRHAHLAFAERLLSTLTHWCCSRVLFVAGRVNLFVILCHVQCMHA